MAEKNLRSPGRPQSQELQLSKRLAMLAGLVDPRTPRIIDIGTDHGYLPISLVLRGLCDQAIAADLRQGPLERARQNIRKYGLEDKISSQLSDGLDQIELVGSDTVIIAGMGANEILRILDRPLPAGLKLIIQAQNAQARLRQGLQEQGLVLEDEKLVRDRRHFYLALKYQVPATNIKGQSLSALEAELGPRLLAKHKQQTFTSVEGQLWADYLKEKEASLAKQVLGQTDLQPVRQALGQLISQLAARDGGDND